MAVKEFLDSDRVNFLIWRYLLEGNYRETAAKFQKEWHVKEPHRDFEFARHVKGHALVSVVNRGLLYYGLERDHARSQPQHIINDARALEMGVFGPLDGAHPPAKMEEDDETAHRLEDLDASRKRSQNPLLNGSPIKRPRLSNGYENGAVDATAPAAMTTTETTTATTLMDVDHQDQHHRHGSQDPNNAYPSPLEGEQVPPPPPRTDGPEQGTQIDKVEELTPDTTFIRLMDETQGREATPSASPAGAPSGESAPILLQCEWNPTDPSVLAAAGTDALARVWTVSRATAPEPGQDHVSPHGHALVMPDTPRSTTVTALCWASDGNMVAVATDSGSKAAVNVWTADGSHVQTMDVAEAPIIKMNWSPSNSSLLAISPDKGGAVVTMFSAASGLTLTYQIPGHDIAATPLDAAWTNDAEFLLCGGDMLMSLTCTDSSITRSRKFETREDDNFTQVLFDWRSKLAATASDKGTLDLWDESGQRRSISAHQGAITTMAWQSLPASDTGDSDERLIATGGDDCAILIWNARKPEAKAKGFLTMDLPIVRLAFTPDGAFLAGATSRQVLIWKVGSYSMPRASWNRPPHPGWMSPKGTTDSDEEDEHCLCWDLSGQKLAYGSNSRLAIINFRR